MINAGVAPWSRNIRQIAQYKIVGGFSIEEIEQKVNDLIGQGWQPYGKLEIINFSILAQKYFSEIKSLNVRFWLRFQLVDATNYLLLKKYPCT